MPTPDAVAEEQRKQDIAALEKSDLREEAVKFLRNTLSSTAKQSIRQKQRMSPDTWSVLYHFEWGMAVRNALRQNGFGEQELGVMNLDNVYITLVEEAVK